MPTQSLKAEPESSSFSLATTRTVSNAEPPVRVISAQRGDYWGVIRSKSPCRRDLLRHVDAQAKLLPSADVEAQTVVVRGGVQVDDPTQGTVRAGL